MKIGVIGAGAVGAACTFALVARGGAREVVVVDRTAKRAQGLATDLGYGVPLTPPVRLRAGGYGDLAGAALVMVTVGVNEKTGGATDRNDKEGRLRLLDKNAAIYREVVPEIARAAPEAVLLVVTDPPDPLADLARRLAPRNPVLSTGTFLDSLRLRVHLAERLGVGVGAVAADILGEHGTSEVMVWSGARIGGVPLDAVLAARGIAAAGFREEVGKAVRFANITIIEGIGASQYGIGMACARIAEAVLRNERLVVPVGSFHAEYGVTLSLPTILGAGGAQGVIAPDLSAEETAQLRRSAEQIRRATERLGQ